MIESNESSPGVEGAEKTLKLLDEDLDVLDIASVVFGSGHRDLLVDPVGHFIGLAQELVYLPVLFQHRLTTFKNNFNHNQNLI